MGLLDRLSDWLEAPYAAFYRCPNCETRFEGGDSSCPECGREIETGETPEMTVGYWGHM
jgi:rubrerythrin